MHIDVNGTRLWFDVDGPALVPDGPEMRPRPTVILLHGGPGSFDHTYFKPDFERLADVAQVVYLDLRDHGRSAWGDPEAWEYETCADDIPAFCDALGIQRPIVLGHSLGGFIAMLYAARHPSHPGGLVLDSTAGRFDVPRLVEGFRRLAGDRVADIVDRVYTGRGPQVAREEWMPVWDLFGRGLPVRSRITVNAALNARYVPLMARFDALRQLARVECPTLVCCGSLDPATSPAIARELHGSLPPGLARLEVIEGAGHFPWKDAPERYWPVLTDFVTRAAAAPTVRS